MYFDFIATKVKALFMHTVTNKGDAFPMLKKLVTLLVFPLCLTACQSSILQNYGRRTPVISASVKDSRPKQQPQQQPQEAIASPRLTSKPQQQPFSAIKGKIAQNYRGLEAWWSFFNDPVLNSLISAGLNMNAAELSNNGHFPEHKMTKKALTEYYKDKRVDLVSSIAIDYIEYRYIQIQNNLLNGYISYQEKMLQASTGRKQEQITTELEYLSQKKHEFAKDLQKASVSLSKSTKLLPEYIDEILKDNQVIPDYDITPILASSAQIITNSARIDTARTRLFYITQGKIGLQKTKNLLPDIRFDQLFGISENVFANPHVSWRVKIGYARKQLNFSALLDSDPSNKQHIRDFKKDVSSYIMEIEGLLVSISALHDQQEVLEKAVTRAVQEDDLYKAHLAAIKAEYEKTKAVIKLFEKLDLY